MEVSACNVGIKWCSATFFVGGGKFIYVPKSRKQEPYTIICKKLPNFVCLVTFERGDYKIAGKLQVTEKTFQIVVFIPFGRRIHCVHEHWRVDRIE